jgi:cyanophycinase
VSGVVALHGGGEFLAGDEPFLRAILAAAPQRSGVVSAAVVPTAAARGRPDLAAANGVEALTRVGASAGCPVQAASVRVVDARSAHDPDLTDRLEQADLIYFPGGDPDLIPALLPGRPAWTAILAAWERGSAIAGASAGAMALGSWTWTPGGGVEGLGLVPGVIVVPHADERSWSAGLRRFGGDAPPHLAVLGLGERTGVLIDNEVWRVVGSAEVRWLPADRRDPDSAVVFRDGDEISRQSR